MPHTLGSCLQILPHWLLYDLPFCALSVLLSPELPLYWEGGLEAGFDGLGECIIDAAFRIIGHPSTQQLVIWLLGWDVNSKMSLCWVYSPPRREPGLHGVTHWHVWTFCFPTACHPEMTLAWLSRYTVLTKWRFLSLLHPAAGNIPQEDFFLCPLFPASWEGYPASPSFLLWGSISPLRNGESQWGKTRYADCICLWNCAHAYANAHEKDVLQTRVASYAKSEVLGPGA